MAENVGLLQGAIDRNPRQVRADRAAEIVELTEMEFGRAVEDARYKVKNLERKQNGQLDLSPDNTTSIFRVSDFDVKAFVAGEKDFLRDLRDAQIELELIEKRYQELFGKPKV